MTHYEVIAQCMLFFLAGYETTASTISFLVYNLTINPDIQEKVYEEIMDVVGNQVQNFALVEGEICPLKK